MFGHTLLRLDQRNQNESNRILAYTVNYAAQRLPEDSELVFVYRGLVGGYPGDTTILPYYMKLKEYSDIESRDIWEYKLTLTQEQTDQLVRHIWEIQSIRFDYYFFTENCSYRVLGMLDAVLPEPRMVEQFNLYTIPVDTVRLPLARGIVSDIAYRPSVVTRFWHQLNELSDEQQRLVYDIVTSPDASLGMLDHLNEESRVNVLEVAYQYSRLVSLPGRSAAKVSYKLLRARQKLEAGSSLSPVPIPEKRDDQGHRSSQVRLARGARDNVDFYEFRIKPAYHDLVDPASGYPIGSELKFVDLVARHYEDGTSSIETLTLIGITSLKGRSKFFKPTSWAVSFGARQVYVEETQRELVPYLAGQLGPTYRWGSSLVYSLFGGEMQLSRELEKGVDLRAQVNLGLLWRLPGTQLALDFKYADSALMDDTSSKVLSYRQTVNINSSWALHLSGSREAVENYYLTEAQIGLAYYF